MKITNIEVQNFRGIKNGEIEFPIGTNIVCFIGAGDSTKSTILKAIEWVLWPTWDLFASDEDFYNGNTEEPIIIRGTFKELPASLLEEDKFGLYLRRNNVLFDSDVDDEPSDESPVCLTIQLTINKSLEPKWEVICNRKEPKFISHNDRKLLSFGIVGNDCGKDMVWGHHSILQKYADAKGILHDAYTVALREITSHADLHNLDEVAPTIVSVGKQYGVGFSSDIKNKMIIQNGSFSSSVGLFEGSIPLNQRGLGSQRLLSMGLNIQAFSGETMLIIDEVESGLEPYRLRSLLNELRTNHENCGQVIMTTHSPIAVAECTISELMVIQSNQGKTTAYQLKGDDNETNKVMQAQVRKNAEAFLCKRIIVCEGKTEMGFIRALDTFLSTNNNYRLSCKGVGMADGCGNTIFKCADILRSCGYEVCLFMDSDLEKEETSKDEQRANGVPVFDWNKGNSIEEQIFADVPTDIAEKILGIAVEEHGLESVCTKLRLDGIPYTTNADSIKLTAIKSETQKSIGTVAKNKRVEWYKRMDIGELVGNVLFKNWDLIDKNTKLHKVIDELSAWVKKYD